LIITIIGGYIGLILGGLDGFIYSLLAFVIIDYITGVMVAITKRKLSSEVGFKGISKKVVIFALVGVGNIIDVYLVKNGSTIRTGIIFFCLSNEGISIIENAGKLGLPIPVKLKIILKELNKEEK